MKTLALILISAVLLQAPAQGIEIQGNTITLSDAEKKMREDEGGCGVITAAYLRSALEQAYKAGSDRSAATCGKRV